MKKNAVRGYIVLAILAGVFTVVAFAAPFNRNNVFSLSVIFAFIAFAAQIYIFNVAFRGTDTVKSKFYGIPLANVGIAYLVAQVALSLAFMTFSSKIKFWLALIVFVVLFGFAAVGFIAADMMRDEIEQQDVALKSEVETMRALQSKVAALPGMTADEDLKKELSSLSEAFRYSDPVSAEALTDIENSLVAVVDELQKIIVEGDTVAACSLIKMVAATLDERNRLCKLNK